MHAAPASQAAVTTYRGPAVENRHQAHVAVVDGNGAILTAVVTELIHRLAIGTPSQRAQLDRFRAPTIKNTVGLEVGHMQVTVPLARQAA